MNIISDNQESLDKKNADLDIKIEKSIIFSNEQLIQALKNKSSEEQDYIYRSVKNIKSESDNDILNILEEVEITERQREGIRRLAHLKYFLKENNLDIEENMKCLERIQFSKEYISIAQEQGRDTDIWAHGNLRFPRDNARVKLMREGVFIRPDDKKEHPDNYFTENMASIGKHYSDKYIDISSTDNFKIKTPLKSQFERIMRTLYIEYEKSDKAYYDSQCKDPQDREEIKINHKRFLEASCIAGQMFGILFGCDQSGYWDADENQRKEVGKNGYLLCYGDGYGEGYYVLNINKGLLYHIEGEDDRRNILIIKKIFGDEIKKIYTKDDAFPIRYLLEEK